MNMDSDELERPTNPYENAWFFKRWTFWWLKDLIKLGLNKPIDSEDIYKNLKSHDAGRITDRFNELWNNERQKKQPRIFNVILNMFLRKVIGLSILYSAVDIISRAAQSHCLGGLLTYFSEQESSSHYEHTRMGIWYGVGLVSCAFVSTAFTNPYQLYATQIGMQIRILCTSLIYRKVLKISKSVSMNGLNGLVINLMSFDSYRFDGTVMLLHALWKGPIEVLVFGYFLYIEIGYYGWIGVGFILCFVPIQIYMGKMTANYRYQLVGHSDDRIRIVNEIIQGIQTIKIYAWEKPFAKIVDIIRKKELKTLRGLFVIRSIFLSFKIVSQIAIFLSLITYVYCGNVFTSRQVFVVTSYFNFIYDSMLLFWTVSMSTIWECMVSMKRIEEFLLMPEEKDSFQMYQIKKLKKSTKSELVPDIIANGLRKCNQKTVHVDEYALDKCVILQDVTAYWANLQAGIEDINLEIKSNQFCAIIGPVGSGKSTILHTILQELEIDKGELTVNGLVSYAAQEPWLFEASVRQNILFTEEYDEYRYKEVIRVCALERDLELLPYADLTIVGERGISLSGGQKARVNLARAIYRRADIYLLDDPLSAVDSVVGKHIFENCIKDFLKDKICILVTHQEQYLKASNHVVYMDNGKVQIQGGLSRLENVHYQSFRRLNSDNDSIDDDQLSDIEEDEVNKSNDAFSRQVECRKEIQHFGSVGFKVYKAYFSAVENICLVLSVITLVIVGQMAVSSVDLFVSKWVKWETERTEYKLQLIMRTAIKYEFGTHIEPERLKYVYFYTVLIVVVLYLVFQRALALFYFCLKASRRIHEKLFNGVTRAQMYFFNTNSSGRIINRFAKDINDIDYYLPIVLYDSIMFLLQVTTSLILVTMANYWLLIPTAIMTIIFLALRHIYVKTARCLKRLESMGRSPIFAHTNATISGLSTIRTYKSSETIIKEFNSLQNSNTSVCFLFSSLAKALALWLELVCVLYMAVVLLIFFIFEKEIIGAEVGLAITQILNMTMTIQWGMRQTAELENNMTSVERVMEYINLKSETDSTVNVEKQPDLTNWAKRGEIEFCDLSLKYSEHSDPTLKSLNLKIRSGEKIGICGRTGAGKSSIIQAIFRLAHNEGVIKIDSTDISTVPLELLRKNISIIPQESILFSGTMRDNLDPFNERSDDELWSALDQVDLRTAVSALPNGLDCQVHDNASNFSVGQRGLVCLARAILRKNKILILDEATAHCDNTTDKFLQKTIREKFADCTVLTIAHRLHTVMDSDRVLVVDGGLAVEFDHAHRLLQNPDGFLTRLVNETGFTASRYLKQIAKQNYERKSH